MPFFTQSAPVPASPRVRLSEVVGALSYALDITEGQPEGHAVRTAMIGMRIGREVYLSQRQRSALFYALLLKDLGCSSNASKLCYLFGADDRAAKFDLKTTNWATFSGKLSYLMKNAAPGGSFLGKVAKILHLARAGEPAARELIELRCDRGASIARHLQMPEETAVAIGSLDEHWNGRGHPRGLSGEEIPILARIASLAQTVEVFHRKGGVAMALEVARARRGTWFDPLLVKALFETSSDKKFWALLSCSELQDALATFEPESGVVCADEGMLDRIATGFSYVIDAKSPWTFRHSESVAEIAVGIAGVMGFSGQQMRGLRRAALLHDIGKLGVSNLILDKPGKLTGDEYAEMQKHPYYTQQILSRVGAFREIAPIAAAHHERLDGAGYPLGLSAERLCLATRILTLADTFEALAARRPYRADLSEGEVHTILEKSVGSAIDGVCYEALRGYLEKAPYVPVALAA